MSALLDRLGSPRPDLCFYGLAPPKLGTPPERLQVIVTAQKGTDTDRTKKGGRSQLVDATPYDLSG